MAPFFLTGKFCMLEYNSMMKIYSFIFIFLFSFNLFAHQPKLINYSPTIAKPHQVIDPEISKAYYGKLNGEPHYYLIESNEEFLFYTGILSPKVEDNNIPLSIAVYLIDQENNKKLKFYKNGYNFKWEAWYEPYARDWYWKGPEIGGEINIDTGFKRSFNLSEGKYLIEVFNKNNIGHYSLAVGEAEFFGSNLWEQILTWTPIILYIGPYMDIVHWQKFDIRAYIPHIVLLVLIFLIYFTVKRLFFKKKKKNFINEIN